MLTFLFFHYFPTRHLRFQPGDLFGSKAGALKQTSSAAEAAAVSEVDVQVTVTHPTDRDSVVVTVPGSANMKQVKEALATKLSRPEIIRNGTSTQWNYVELMGWLRANKKGLKKDDLRSHGC